MARYQIDVTEVKSGSGCGTLLFWAGVALLIIGVLSK